MSEVKGEREKPRRTHRRTKENNLADGGHIMEMGNVH